MHKIILADNQSVFRAGAARALASEVSNRIVAQCETTALLLQAVESFPGSTVLVAHSLLRAAGDAALDAVTGQATAAGSRTILIAENGESSAEELLLKVDGAVSRSVSAADLLECVRSVGQGQRAIVRPGGEVSQLTDAVGERVRDRLTPKELQIVALIVQGCRNREIATQLETTEQVIKNYLRSIYDKCGVSDRLELALFTVHHRILAEAAAQAGHRIQHKNGT